MKPMKFFNSEQDHFPKTFSNIEVPSKFKYIKFQSINWPLIEILIKINVQKALKLNSLDTFLKVVLRGVK